MFWISKQILQLIMEDAIDDWLLRHIQWLRKEEVIAQGIRWLQDVSKYDEIDLRLSYSEVVSVMHGI